MKSRLVAALFLAMAADCTCAAEPGDDVLAAARSFADGGGYLWKDGSGSPVDVEHGGETIIAAQKQGTYCSGFTFAVVTRAAMGRDLLGDKTPDQLRRFQKQWYGATEESAETQCALAVEELGVGQRVERLEDARPGDFVQLWRTNKSGHSVVLVALARDDAGEIIGLHYRSSQTSTDGIGDRTEFFSDAESRGGKLDRRRIYIARLDEKSR